MANCSKQFTRDNFIECKWRYDVLDEEHYGYSSIMQRLQKDAKEKSESGQEVQSKILELLSRTASMMLSPNSLNEPFKPYFQDYQAGRRSVLPDDFTTDELAFFNEIIDDINEPWLKARISDLLWLCNKPKNPDHAKIAIESYIVHSIDPTTWNSDVKNCWERAARICLQIKDFDKLNEIKNQLFAAFCCDYSSSKFMKLWLAELMDRLNVDVDFREDIASTLFSVGNDLMEEGDFNSAKSYFEFTAKKYKLLGDEQSRIKTLVMIADCFEREADIRSKNSNMVANSFYENAIQAYRCIPSKHRDAYDVDNRIKVIRTKITKSGKASLEEMGLVKTPGVDISDIIESSIAHVSGKNSFEEALIYFAGLYSGPKYSELVTSAKDNMKKSIIGSLFGSFRMSSDGRVVAKTPPMNLNAGEDDTANQEVLNQQLQQQFAIEVQLVVEGRILPALRQLLMEYRITKEFLEAMCNHSPIVPKNRQYLLGYALWLGFEHDFGNAVHLLCPQVEHIVRTQLKEAGAHTSNIDQEGIENENGLSTLMGLPEATHIFGDDLVFEMKSVFTDSLGFNLRNEVAHGLLDDNSSSTISTIYAWWMILRLVIHSIIRCNKHDNEAKSERE